MVELVAMWELGESNKIMCMQYLLIQQLQTCTFSFHFLSLTLRKKEIFEKFSVREGLVYIKKMLNPTPTPHCLGSSEC